MNWVDVVIIVLALIGAYVGWKQGLIRTLFSVVGLIVGVVLAGQWSDSLADKLSPGGAQWASIVAFALIVIVVLIVANIIGGIVKRFIKFMMMGWLDLLGGIVLGLCVGALMIAAILTIVAKTEFGIAGTGGAEEAIQESRLAELLMENFGLLLGLLPGEFDFVRDFFA